MLSATGVHVQLVFVAVFAFGAGLAGFAGVVGGTFQSLQPGEDIKILLASLVVVIVGGMGSITGAAVGAVLIGLAEQFGSVYMPTYAVVLILHHHGGRAGRAAAGPAARALSHGPGRSALARRATAPAKPAGIGLAAAVDGLSGALAAGAVPAAAAGLRERLRAGGDFRLRAHSRHDRFEPDVPRRLRRHGEPGADERRRLRRLHGGDFRHQRGERDQPRLALVAGGVWWRS